MKLMPVLGILLRQYALMRSSPMRVLPMFAWVAIDIVLWGFITRWLNKVSASHIDFVPSLLGAVLLWDFFTRVMQGVTNAFFEDLWSRNFLNIFAAPLSIGEYLAGLVLAGIATSLIGLYSGCRSLSTAFTWRSFSWCYSCSASLWVSWPAPWCCVSGRLRNGWYGRSRHCCRPSPACSTQCRPCPAGCS
jgi:ABC-2 type transport system permease protein